MVTKILKFCYYQAIYDVDFIDENQSKKIKSGLFDLMKFSEYMKTLDENERLRPYLGEKVRAEVLKEITNNQYKYPFIHFERLNHYPTEYIRDEHKVSERDIELDEEEYIANDASMIFDPSNQVIILQKNISSISAKGISTYLTHFANQNLPSGYSNATVTLVPIVNKQIFLDAKRGKKYLSVDVKTANIYTKKNSGFKYFGQSRLMKSMNETVREFGALNIEFKLTKVPHNQQYSLNDGQVIDLIDDVSKNPSDYNKANIETLDEENDAKEVLDLLKATLVSRQPVEVKTRQDLSCYRVADIMIDLYLQKKDVIDQNLSATETSSI